MEPEFRCRSLRRGPASGSLKQRLPSDLGGRSFELWPEALTLDATEGGGDEVVNEEDGEREPERIVSGGRRPGRQMARRSGLLAKQVISVSSARSLGFVSQLWVDASSVRAPPPCTCFRLAKLSDVTLASS